MIGHFRHLPAYHQAGIASIAIALAASFAEAQPPPRAATASASTTTAAAALAAELERELTGTLPSDASLAADGTAAAASASGRPRAATNLLPDISAIFTGLAKWFADAPTPRFPAHEPTFGGGNGGFGFQLQELELALQAAVDPYVRADLFFAFSLDGVELEEAYLTTLGLPAGLQLRFGELYTPFGRFNTQHFLEMSPFVDMPLPNRHFIGGEQLRGLGFELSWLLPLPWYAEIKSSLTTAQNELSFAVPRNSTSGIEDFLTVHRLEQFHELSHTWSLLWGASLAQGPNESGGAAARRDNRTQLYGGHLYLKWRHPSSIRSVAFQGEYIVRRALLPNGRLTAGGLYGQIDARVNRRWQLSGRYDQMGPQLQVAGTPAPAGEIAAYFAAFEQFRWSAAASYYFSEFQRWRLQYNFDKLLGTPASVLAALPSQLETPARAANHELFLQVQFVLGSHGAHPF